MYVSSESESDDALTVLSTGTYGSILLSPLKTRPVSEVRFCAAPPTFADTAVYKVVLSEDDVKRDSLRVPDILRAVDPTHAFTLPYESLAELTRESVHRVLRDPACEHLARAYKKYPSPFLQIAMRRGVPFYDYLKQADLDVSKVFTLLQNLIRGAHTMHGHGIGHGDIKLDNVVYCPADDALRFIDFDFMFAYGLQSPVVVTDAAVWSNTLQSLNKADLLRIVYHACYDSPALTCFGEAVYFPPDNLFMNVKELFKAENTLEHVLATYDYFRTDCAPLSAKKLSPDWQTALSGQYCAELNRLRALGKTAYANQLHAIVAAHYHPDKHMIYQLGFLLYEVRRIVRNGLHADVHVRMLELCSDCMMPLAAQRLDWGMLCERYGALVTAVKTQHASPP